MVVATQRRIVSHSVGKSDCWRVAYGFIARGEPHRAAEVCEQHPCSDVIECQRYLGWTYYQKSEYTKSLAWFMKAAAEHDGDACFGIGSVNFVQRHFDVALRYFEQAASLGYARAFHWIAYMYHQGLGVPRNLDLAVTYYQKAASKGFVVADRALIHIRWQTGGVFARILMLPRLARLTVKTLLMAGRDINDPRIADVPNAFDKRK